MTDGDKKIIVDEDWKAQVAREKSGTDIEADTKTDPVSVGDLPEATFEVLVSTLAAQAMAAMGHVVDPNTGKPMEIRLDIAKLQIDLLQVLDEKTKGNLDLEDEKLLTDAIHNMRMLYVASQKVADNQK